MIYGFLFLCKYEFEGFLQAYETLYLKFPSKTLRLNEVNEYVISTQDITSTIDKIYEIFFGNCIEYEYKRLQKIDPDKSEELRSSFSKSCYENIREYLKSVLVQENRSRQDEIEFEYFCEHIFPKIKASIL
jgi:hypothetical protein